MSPLSLCYRGSGVLTACFSVLHDQTKTIPASEPSTASQTEANSLPHAESDADIEHLSDLDRLKGNPLLRQVLWHGGPARELESTLEQYAGSQAKCSSCKRAPVHERAMAPGQPGLTLADADGRPVFSLNLLGELRAVMATQDALLETRAKALTALNIFVAENDDKTLPALGRQAKVGHTALWPCIGEVVRQNQRVLDESNRLFYWIGVMLNGMPAELLPPPPPPVLSESPSASSVGSAESCATVRARDPLDEFEVTAREYQYALGSPLVLEMAQQITRAAVGCTPRNDVPQPTTPVRRHQYPATPPETADSSDDSPWAPTAHAAAPLRLPLVQYGDGDGECDIDSAADDDSDTGDSYLWSGTRFGFSLARHDALRYGSAAEAKATFKSLRRCRRTSKAGLRIRQLEQGALVPMTPCPSRAWLGEPRLNGPTGFRMTEPHSTAAAGPAVNTVARPPWLKDTVIWMLESGLYDEYECMMEVRKKLDDIGYKVGRNMDIESKVVSGEKRDAMRGSEGAGRSLFSCISGRVSHNLFLPEFQ